MYIRSLNMQPALDCVAVFATASSFAYLLSWVVLHDRFIGVRVSGFCFHLGSHI